jgi:hypothetical protein
VDKEEEEKKRIKEYNTKVLPNVLKKHRKEHQIELDNNQKIKDILTRDDIADFFQVNEKIVKGLFNHGVNITFSALELGARSSIPLKTLSLLATNLRITPIIFKHREIILIFKSLTKKKEIEPGNKEVGLTYEDFQNAILRICIKGQQMFNAVGESLKANGKISEGEMTKIIEDNDDETRFNSNGKLLPNISQGENNIGMD